jgi:Subtilase family
MQTIPSPRLGFRGASFLLAVVLVLGLAPKGGLAQGPIRHPGLGQLGDRIGALPSTGLRAASPMAQGVPALQPGPQKNPKLTTTVADLARATTQRLGPVAKGQRIAPPPGFSMAALPKSVQDAVQTRRMRINKDAEVQVYIEVSEVTDQNLEALRGLGVTVQIVGTPKPDKARKEVLSRVPTVQGLLPVSMIDPVSALPFVRFVRLPDYGIRQTGSVDSEGDAMLKADQVRSRLGVDGTGVRVGVISDGINGIFAAGCTTCGPTTATPSPISSGDLPDASGTRNASGVLTSVSGGITAQSFRSDSDLEGALGPGCVEQGAGAEGTGLLEIVHDLAPGARLFFANLDTSLGFQQAVTWVDANTDVGVDDVGFFTPPYDGTSPVSQNTADQLNNDANPVRAYFTAVGNEAGYHYAGQYVDSGTDPGYVGYPGDLHLFQPSATTSDILGLGATHSDVVELPAGANVLIDLTWNDPFGASSNDYDLYLVQSSTGTVVAESADTQSGTQDPEESLGYINNTGAEDAFYIVIQNAENLAAPRTFDMFVFSDRCAGPGPVRLAPYQDHNYNTVGGSIVAQGDAGGSPAGVISVGAANWQTPDTLEGFSSQGSTLDGRLKPEVTGIDGVSITGADDFGSLPSGTTPQTFLGTSAAAPHGAGVAALLLQAVPCLMDGSPGALASATARVDLRNLVLNNAVDLGTPGPDNAYGYGRIDALASANATLPAAVAGPDQTVNGTVPGGASVTLNGSGSSEPLGCPLALHWAGTCSTATGASPTVTCPIGTNTETLTVTDNGVTLSPESSVQITVTSFAIHPTPSSTTVSPGRAATYALSIAPQYGAFTNAVSLACTNLPARTACRFSPRSVTPGSGGAASTLTLSTTAPTAVFNLPFGLPPAYGLGIAFMALCLLSLMVLQRPARRRLATLGLAAGLFVFILTMQVACGEGSSAPTNPGTTAGTYTVTVTGTSGSLVNSAPIVLTVQ